MSAPKIKLNDIPHRTLKQLCRTANGDSDPVTIAWLGDREESAQGAVIVVRGNITAQFVARHLEGLKLYRPHLVKEGKAS